MGFLKEFKEFAVRGNVVDMAVGIVIGGAFGKIVSSFVSDVLMPPIGLALGDVDFRDLALTLQEATVAADGTEVAAVTLNWGAFASTIVDFVIIAFAIFLVVRTMNRMQRREEAAPAAPPAPPREEVLLTEIRDLLKQRAD